jgi:hypothetical protein
MTRAEKKRLEALSDTQSLTPITLEELCNTSRELKVLASQHPTLAALVFWERHSEGT